MAWTRYQISLALLMVVTGSINTIATKWADSTYSVGSDGGEATRQFNHPFLQAVGMFLGEFTCMIAFKAMVQYYGRKQRNDPTVELPRGITGNQNFSPLIFLAPAMCDMLATSIMYIGLTLTYASSFQMFRGSVIVFTSLLSVAFLNRKVKNYEWLGILFVIIGLLVVGASDVIYPPKAVGHKGVNSLITGDLLIIMAQIIAATQMVVEEKFVGKHNVPPLQAVGWEGLFGMVVLAILIIPFSFIPAGQQIFTNPNNNVEDVADFFAQLSNSWEVAVGFLGTILSISFFNFAGISVTKELNATTRMVLDSVRTLVIWLFSLAVSWQTFSYIQLIGFVVLFCGMCIYNNIFFRPFMISRGWLQPSYENDQIEPIISSEDKIDDCSVNSTETRKY